MVHLIDNCRLVCKSWSEIVPKTFPQQDQPGFGLLQEVSGAGLSHLEKINTETPITSLSLKFDLPLENFTSLKQLEFGSYDDSLLEILMRPELFTRLHSLKFPVQTVDSEFFSSWFCRYLTRFTNLTNLEVPPLESKFPDLPSLLRLTIKNSRMWLATLGEMTGLTNLHSLCVQCGLSDYTTLSASCKLTNLTELELASVEFHSFPRQDTKKPFIDSFIKVKEP